MRSSGFTALLLAVLASAACGCRAIEANTGHGPVVIPATDVPRELDKVVLPQYVIESPDILVIDAVKVVPRPPYRVASLDVLFVRASGTFAEYPIEGNFSVEPGGFINFGPPYGAVRVGRMTIPEAAEEIRRHLANYVEAPVVDAQLAQSSALQQIAGEHLVGPDGTVQLGVYGEVLVVGLTRPQAQQAIEAHLARFLEEPEVSVDVLSYNSKVYYVITQGGGFGDSVHRLPITGNETVLDAISQVEGLQPHSSEQIWIARPSPAGSEVAQILPVDWNAIVQGGATETNYQILPGDRIFIAEDCMVAFDSFIARVTSPFERLFGFTLLGTSTVSRLRFFHQGQNSGSSGGGF